MDRCYLCDRFITPGQSFCVRYPGAPHVHTTCSRDLDQYIQTHGRLRIAGDRPADDSLPYYLRDRSIFEDRPQ